MMMVADSALKNYSFILQYRIYSKPNVFKTLLYIYNRQPKLLIKKLIIIPFEFMIYCTGILTFKLSQPCKIPPVS